MTERRHTSREFEKELQTLKERLLTMAGRAEQQITRAVEAVIRGDRALARSVVDDDALIDQDEIEIDDLAFYILARRQPVASDLRFIMTALKIVTDLERIGDLAVNIAKREADLGRTEVSPVLPRISQLAQKVLAALRRSLDAFVNADADEAAAVIRADPEIDALNTRIISGILSETQHSQGEIATSLATSSVSRYLERIGDHATNIAEMVIYFARGRDVRHSARKTKRD